MYLQKYNTIKLNVTAKYELVEGNTYKVTFDTTQLSANCNEGELLNTVRINAMSILGDTTQGAYYLDSVEFIGVSTDE